MVTLELEWLWYQANLELWNGVYVKLFINCNKFNIKYK